MKNLRSVLICFLTAFIIGATHYGTYWNGVRDGRAKERDIWYGLHERQSKVLDDEMEANDTLLKQNEDLLRRQIEIAKIIDQLLRQQNERKDDL